MSNAQSIFDYHLETSHNRGNLLGRSLDWGDQPVPFKLYRGIHTVPMPQEFSLPDIPLDKAMAARSLMDGDIPTILGAICNLACGITQVQKHSQGKVFHFRSVASAGALYPTELYVALQNVTGLNDGLYHYCPLEHTMSHLKAGQVFSALAGSEPIIRFYLTSIFHRSAWKYGPRAYRYCLLDAGHMAENLLLAARIHGFPARLDYDFSDTEINDFLCIDPALEGCVAQVHGLGCSPETQIFDTVPPKSCNLDAFSQSAAKSTAPEGLLNAHTLCSVTGSRPAFQTTDSGQETTPLHLAVIPASTSSTIHRRRSKRNFIPATARTRDLVDILRTLCHDMEPDNPYGEAIQVGFIANENSGLPPGHHHLNRATNSTTLLRAGQFTGMASRVCLDQSWLENAALHVVFTADIRALEAQCGPRAYRYAHLEAGRMGQRVYLGATAKNMGACGIGAFFDQEAATLLDLPEGHALLYLVAAGPIKK